MKIRLGKGAISAVAVTTLVAGIAQASQTFAVRDIGVASTVRSTILATDAQNAPVYADNHEKAGEGKCGEGKCGDDKTAEGKCGEGKCGEGKCGDENKDDKTAEGKCGDSHEDHNH